MPVLDPWARRALVGLGTVLLVACNRNRPDVTGPNEGSPAAAAQAPQPLVAAAPEIGIVEGSGLEPAGFKTLIVSDPKRDEEGEIHGSSPLTVEFDACRSSGGEAGSLYYYFDWDFDHRADVWGREDACRQVHTYRTQPVERANGDDVIRTNICLATADLRLRDPDTYVSCREFTIVLPKVAAGGQSCHAINTGTGGVCPTGATQVCISGGIDPTSSAHAQAACEACAGAGACLASGTVIGGAVWYDGASSIFWYQSATNPFVVCTSYTPLAGDISDQVGCPAGRWAP